MAEFRKKPVVIEAVPVEEVIRASKSKEHELPGWVVDGFIVSVIAVPANGMTRRLALADDESGINVNTAEGVMFGAIDDWLIRGVAGELYPCKPDIFEATYEPVESPRADITLHGLMIHVDGSALKRLDHGEALRVGAYLVQKLSQAPGA